MKKLIFMPTDEEKTIITDCTHESIEVILKHCKDNLGMKAFVMNILIDTFLETYNVDLRNESTLHKSSQSKQIKDKVKL